MLWHRCKCGALIPQNAKKCAACAAGEKTGPSRHMEYNRFRRDKKTADFYVSAAWRNARLQALQRYDGLDLYALYVQKKITPADMVHHIVEIEDDWNLRLDPENLFPLSNTNHGVISALYKKDAATKRRTQDELRAILAKHRAGAGGI